MENFEDCKQPHAFFAILDPFIPLCVPRSAAQRGNCLNLQFNDHSFRAALVGGTTAAQSVGARSESSSHRKDVIMKEHQFLLHSSINKRDGGGAPAALDWGIRARQLSVRFWECFRAEMTREAFPDKYTDTHTHWRRRGVIVRWKRMWRRGGALAAFDFFGPWSNLGLDFGRFSHGYIALRCCNESGFFMGL